MKKMSTAIDYRSAAVNYPASGRLQRVDGGGIRSREGRRRNRKKSAFEITNEQYQQLKEQLALAVGVQEKNIIYRRLINLLEVMQFLNSNSIAE